MSDYSQKRLESVDPREFYAETFITNYPRPRFARAVGFTATKILKPELIYPEGKSRDDYLELLKGRPGAALFNHPGRRTIHDPAAGLTAVAQVPDWMERVKDHRVWAKAPILQHPKYRFVTEHLGAQAVMRKEEMPLHEDRDAWTEALLEASVAHVHQTGGVVDMFPHGTREGTEVLYGAGRFAERLDADIGAILVPIALASSNEEDGQLPKDLQISYGVPIPVEGAEKGFEWYTEQISERLDEALDRIAA